MAEFTSDQPWKFARTFTVMFQQLVSCENRKWKTFFSSLGGHICFSFFFAAENFSCEAISPGVPMEIFPLFADLTA
jgi:hypothetical protein